MKLRIFGLMIIFVFCFGMLAVHGEEPKELKKGVSLDLKYELLCEMVADLGVNLELGTTPYGTRIIAPVLKGAIKLIGEKINAESLLPSGDWILVRNDGVMEIDVRLALKTNEGDLIYMNYKGIIKIPPAVGKRMQNGENVEASEYYFRSTPRFETASEKYKWLNDVICVGVGMLGAKQVKYKIYQIL